MAMSFNSFGLITGGSKGNIASTEKSSKDVSNSDKSVSEQATALTATDTNCIMDGFDGKDIAGTFDMSKMTPEMIAAAETIGSVASAETAGSIASVETAGSIASAETIGSVASAETAGSIAFDGGGGFDSGSDGGFSSFG